jgi:hypothetical protein
MATTLGGRTGEACLVPGAGADFVRLLSHRPGCLCPGRRLPVPIARLARQARTDECDKADSTDPMLAAEPTENTDATDPAEPMDRIDPADPIDRIDPAEPMDRIDPVDPMLRIEPAEPADPAEPAGLLAGEALLARMIAFSQQALPARGRRAGRPPPQPGGSEPAQADHAGH